MVVLVFLFCMLFPLILMWMYLVVTCLVLHILLYKTVAFVFSRFSLVFL